MTKKEYEKPAATEMDGDELDGVNGGVNPFEPQCMSGGINSGNCMSGNMAHSCLAGPQAGDGCQQGGEARSGCCFSGGQIKK